MKIPALVCAALLCFAANSLLCRLALGSGSIDAATFTSVRLASGALMLVLLVGVMGRGDAWRWQGSWVSGAALFGYAVAFSFAYLRLPAWIGGLILFGTVQATMIGWGLRKGERPRPLVWLGLGVSVGGLVLLTLPGGGARASAVQGSSSPDPIGAGLMLVAGISWGVYSLRGRGTKDPVAATAGHFVRTLPLAALASLLMLGHFQVSARGVLLAAASGALASGLGYSLWYAALPSLTSTRAAILQLTVPVIVAAGAVLLLGETLTLRASLSGVAIIAGVLMAVLSR